MSTLLELRDAEVKAARVLVDAAKTDVRELTAEEVGAVQGHLGKAAELSDSIKAAGEKAAMFKQLASFADAGPVERPAEVNEKAPRDLIEHFLKSDVAQKAKAFSGGDRITASTTEFKAATDPTLTTGITVPVQYGMTVQTKYRRLTVSDLLAQGSISGNALTYWTQGTLTGDVTSIAEGGTKPSLNFAFSQVTETLTKLAGVTKVSDEMMSDLDFLVSVIQSQLGQRLGVVEEDQLLNGNGTAPNLRGLLNRVGVQTYATTATYSAKKGMDALFHALTMIRTGSFIEPDGIVINPTDYEALRLGVDGNVQYYGGGPFTGAYGNSGIQQQPGLWGLPTVVTPAIAAGTVLVGAFGTGAQVFRKGGVRLETTNSNEDDFKKNLVAWRIEERVALACYYPAAFVKLTLTA